MNRFLIASAATLMLTGAALAQEPWASSIQTEGSPSNAVVYGLESAPVVPNAYGITTGSIGTATSADRLDAGPSNGRPAAWNGNQGDAVGYFVDQTARGF